MNDLKLLNLLKKISKNSILKKIIYPIIPNRYHHLRRFTETLNVKKKIPKERFEKKHSVLIGSGPSSVKFNYSNFIIDDTFFYFMNGSARLMEKDKKRSNLYCSFDPNFIKNSFNVFLQGLENSYALFVSYEVWCELYKIKELDLSRVYVLDFFHTPYWKVRRKINELRSEINGEIINYRIGFSDNPFLSCFSGESVAYGALQIALFLKTEKVDFFGLDFTNGGERFYKEKTKLPSRLNKSFEKTILPSFSLAKKKMLERNIQFINHSDENILGY